MDRNIVTTADAENAPEDIAADGNWIRLLKYIPGETIGAYVAAEGVVKTMAGQGQRVGLLFLFLVLTAFNLVYLRRIQNVKRWLQVAISEVAFSVYVFAVGGFWTSFSWWQSGWGSLAVIGFALFAVFAKPTIAQAPAAGAPLEAVAVAPAPAPA